LSPRDSAIAILKSEQRGLGNVVHVLQQVRKASQLIATMLYYSLRFSAA